MAPAAGVKVSVPVALMAGEPLNRVGLPEMFVVVTLITTVWAGSPGGPDTIFVAKFGIVRLPPSFTHLTRLSFFKATVCARPQATNCQSAAVPTRTGLFC